VDPETKKTILTVKNHHVNACGEPPSFNEEEVAYISYFQNDYGEQMIFVIQERLGKALLYHGDCGWERPYEVRQVTERGAWVLMRDGVVCGHIGNPTLNDPEQMFITACMHASIFIRTGADYNRTSRRVLTPPQDAETLRGLYSDLS
jgi:hypothetical protein